ncbi:hypothetical protein HYC85_022649 [Camellia sinensis]|uniref:Acid phosphatase n=1 Tax=Camellia sinensis TaxID=4442 RepID=A0A7J7GCF2_CAMSI|nr:hypothetical protein HYC85_022649 [Camellia sinensis]
MAGRERCCLRGDIHFGAITAKLHPYLLIFVYDSSKDCKESREVDGFLVEFCRLEVFDGVEFDKWVDKAMAPPIESSLKLYEVVLKLGFKVFLLTGRSEQQSGVTVANLINSGFQDWDKLILRATEDHGKLATIYKSKKRNEMVEEGYWILGNSGDQWSDLLGSSVSIRSFKLPNPMYYIP